MTDIRQLNVTVEHSVIVCYAAVISLVYSKIEASIWNSVNSFTNTAFCGGYS